MYQQIVKKILPFKFIAAISDRRAVADAPGRGF
jgi:hypothetical protein